MDNSRILSCLPHISQHHHLGSGHDGGNLDGGDYDNGVQEGVHDDW